MSIKPFQKNQRIAYQYARSGDYSVQFSDNLSSAVFSGEDVNGLKDQLVAIDGIGDYVKELGGSAFAGCTRLERAVLGRNVETIGAKCFDGCANLSSAQLPAALKTIGANAFQGCKRLPRLAFSGYDSDTQEPHQLASVQKGAFSGAAALNALVLPPSVNATSKLAGDALAGSSVNSLSFTGVAGSGVAGVIASKCFGLNSDCDIYTSDGKKYRYSKGATALVQDTGYSRLAGTGVSTGRKDKMALGRKAYTFNRDVVEWCTDPSKQGDRFPKRQCPFIVLFLDSVTSAKSRAFIDNVLKSPDVKKWMRSELNCYVLVMDRAGVCGAAPSGSDLAYYRAWAAGKGAGADFVQASFCYGSAFTSAVLWQCTPDEFKSVVKERSEMAGFSRFDPTGYDTFAAEPDPETVPSGAASKSGISAFHGRDPDWFRGSTPDAPAAWDPGAAPMNFRKVATPDTTYVLVCTYDMKQSSDPAETKTELFPILAQFSDHANFYDRCSSNNKHFMPGVAEGVKYRYFIFYMWSHGADGYVTIDGTLTKTDMWNAFSKARGRIFGVISACHSGSMFKAGAGGAASAGVSGDEAADYLVKKFERRKYLMQALFGASTADVDPDILVWSGCKGAEYEWYEPKQYTYTQKGVCAAWNDKKDTKTNRFGDVFQKFYDTIVQMTSADEHHSHPQRKTYGADFQQNIAFS